MIKKWLEAGYLENNLFYETRTGTPQGGIISPLLANIALHGMEEALNIRYKQCKTKNSETHVNISKYVVIKYADDFIILCKTLEDAKDVYNLLSDYLNDRGLTLASNKTKITHINDGFDFLGFNIRCYKGQDRNKVLVKASKDSIKSFKMKAKSIVKNCYPWNVEYSIAKLNYLINGTGNYWRIGSNKRTFSKMDNYIYEILLRQVKRWYPNKSTKWIVNKHFNMLARKLQKAGLTEKEVRICVLTLLNYGYDEMADILFYASNGIGKFKMRTAKKIGTTAKNLRDYLINMTIQD